MKSYHDIWVGQLQDIAARNGEDPEMDHIEADEILLEILSYEGGYADIIKLYNSIKKWYA